MVARPGGYAGVGQTELGGHHRDDGLGSVASRHRQRVGPTLHGATHELFEVLAGCQLDRLDPPALGLLGELELSRLAAARLRVVEQDGMARCRCPRQAGPGFERSARRGERGCDGGQQQ